MVNKVPKRKISPYVIIILVYVIIYVLAMLIINHKEPKPTEQENILSDEFELNQALGMLSHRYIPIENPNEFDSTCVILSAEEFSKERYDSMIEAAKYLFEHTGIQYYYFDVDVTGITDSNEMDRDVKAIVNFQVYNPEYAIVNAVCYSSFYSIEEESDYYLIKRKEFIVGDKAKEFFDTEGLHYFEELYDYYGCIWYSTLGSCVTEFCETTLNYGKEEEQRNIANIIATVLLIVLVISTIVYGLYRKYIEDTIRILNTPMEELKTEADELVEKYIEE